MRTTEEQLGIIAAAVSDCIEAVQLIAAGDSASGMRQTLNNRWNALQAMLRDLPDASA